MEDILDKIVADTRNCLAEKMKACPAGYLRDKAASTPSSVRSMSQALDNSATGIIAEFKRKSPSKGWIHEDADPLKVIPEYASSGAAALSVLTAAKYFGGSLDHIQTVRSMVNIPILRKDFIVSEYQLLEARAAEADAVLLIAACLQKEQVAGLAEKAHELGLEVLLEVHTEKEIGSYVPGIEMVGINNRNLGTFKTDVMNSFRLYGALKEYAGTLSGGHLPVFVSESGISDPETVRHLRNLGFRGFLMGENFMKEDEPGAALRKFISRI